MACRLLVVEIVARLSVLFIARCARLLVPPQAWRLHLARLRRLAPALAVAGILSWLARVWCTWSAAKSIAATATATATVAIPRVTTTTTTKPPAVVTAPKRPRTTKPPVSGGS